VETYTVHLRGHVSHVPGSHPRGQQGLMSIAKGAIGYSKGIIRFFFIHAVPSKLPGFIVYSTPGSSYFTLGVTGKLKNNTGIFLIFKGFIQS
jgi:hypothetical protein